MDVVFDSITQVQWETYCDAVDAPLQQRWAYGETVQMLGGTVLRACVRDQGVPIAIVQALCRRLLFRFCVIMRGPVWIGNVDAKTRQIAHLLLKDALRKTSCRCHLITANDGTVVQIGHPIMTPATVAEVSLGPDMRQALHGKWRNRLSCAESNLPAPKLLSKRSKDHDWLFASEQLQRTSRRYRNLPHSFSEAWLKARSSHTLTIVTGKRSPRAGMMFLRHGTTATYHIGWTSTAARKENAHTALMWWAMNELHRLGVKTLDLGQLDTEQTPGLARFKLGTGAKPHILGPTTLSV